MKQVYIIKDKHPRLLLFFAGWGADETPFKGYQPADSDYMLCYDYRTLDFDTSLLKTYQEINVIGWSMGVWAASPLKHILLRNLFREGPVNPSRVP